MDAFNRILFFLGRPRVQIQIAAVILSFLLARPIEKALLQRTKTPVTSWLHQRLGPRMQKLAGLVLDLLEAALYPLLVLLIMELVAWFLVAVGLVNGLVYRFSWILWALLLFRLFMVLLYLVFSTGHVKFYYYRFFLPLFIVSMVILVLDNLTDLQAIADLVVVTLFDTPLTVKALFLTSFGLYFWINFIFVLQEFVYSLLIRKTSIDPGELQATLTLLRYIFIIIGIASALSILRLNPTTVAAITAGLSVGIGFGFQEILTNLVSGLLILSERSLRPGDVIEINGQMGTVVKVSIRTTTVMLQNYVELIIPNQTFLKSSVTTYSGSNDYVQTSLQIPVGSKYLPDQVIPLLVDIASQQPKVLKDPPPEAVLKEFNLQGFVYTLNFTLDNPLSIMMVKSELNRKIWEALSQLS